jgi:hypothetical protein
MPLGVKDGRPRAEGGGPAGVVEGILRNERRSGVEGGSDEGTANIFMCWSCDRLTFRLSTSG